MNQHSFFYKIGISNNVAGCLVLFENIVSALENNDEVFDLPMPELPVHQSDSDVGTPNSPNRSSGYN